MTRLSPARAALALALPLALAGCGGGGPSEAPNATTTVAPSKAAPTTTAAPAGQDGGGAAAGRACVVSLFAHDCSVPIMSLIARTPWARHQRAISPAMRRGARGS